MTTSPAIATRRNPLTLIGGLILAGLLGLGAPSAEAATIGVEGVTTGCFTSGCTTFSGTAVSSSTYGVTFTGSTIDLMTDPSGSATLIDLGSMGRDNTNVSSSLPPLSFTLQVTFTLPSGLTGGQDDYFSALIFGTAPGGGGPLDVNFDNAWQTLTYSNAFGSGAFEFAVINDPQLSKNSLSNPSIIYGGIRNATFTPVNTPQPTVDAPEPASLLLIGMGAAACALRRRGRGTVPRG